MLNHEAHEGWLEPSRDPTYGLTGLCKRGMLDGAPFPAEVIPQNWGELEPCLRDLSGGTKSL